MQARLWVQIDCRCGHKTAPQCIGGARRLGVLGARRPRPLFTLMSHIVKTIEKILFYYATP